MVLPRPPMVLPRDRPRRSSRLGRRSQQRELGPIIWPDSATFFGPEAKEIRRRGDLLSRFQFVTDNQDAFGAKRLCCTEARSPHRSAHIALLCPIGRRAAASAEFDSKVCVLEKFIYAGDRPRGRLRITAENIEEGESKDPQNRKRIFRVHGPTPRIRQILLGRALNDRPARDLAEKLLLEYSANN